MLSTIVRNCPLLSPVVYSFMPPQLYVSFVFEVIVPQEQAFRQRAVRIKDVASQRDIPSAFDVKSAYNAAWYDLGTVMNEGGTGINRVTQINSVKTRDQLMTNPPPTSTSPVIMHGMKMPDVATWSERVTVALGQNPGSFTGPGTNTYLVGTGSNRILIDTGDGRTEYLAVLDRALEQAECGIQEIILTHGHGDHLGGVKNIHKRYGRCPVSKMPWPEIDGGYPFQITPLQDACIIETQGARLHGIHTPGHAPDHLCFMLEQEQTLFTGDNVLGVGTTVIPTDTGDLAQYMTSLTRLLERKPVAIYPAHGPFIEDGVGKLEEYIAHRWRREEQILAALAEGVHQIDAMVKIIYAAYPSFLYAAAGQSVCSHLLKLEREARVRRDGRFDALPTQASWYPVPLQ